MLSALSLPFVAQAAGALSQKAAREEMAYSDFLEALLSEEAAGRKVRQQRALLHKSAEFVIPQTPGEITA